MPRATYTTNGGELRPRRAALVGEALFSQTRNASLSSQWITHAENSLLHRTLGQMTLRSARIAHAGELPSSAAAGVSVPVFRRRSTRPLNPSHPILKRRPRLDLVPIRSESPNPDPTDQICRYRFALVLLLKSPSVFLKSTRHPSVCKTNYSWAQILADNPLNFPRIEPAVLTCSFMS